MNIISMHIASRFVEVYMVYDSWEQGRQVITVATAGDGKPNGRVIYMTRSQFKRERDRRKGKAQPAKPPTAAAPSVAKVSPLDTTTLYEYPPRRAEVDKDANRSI